MHPTVPNEATAHDHFEDDLNLSILGFGVDYPPYRHGPEALETVANRFYKPSPAMSKVLSINRFTGIETRASVGYVDHPLINQPEPPTIKQLDDNFREEGVRLSVNACKRAIDEWGGSANDITHIVSTTCTNSANPGFDHFVRKELGIRSSAERVLLHGVGCSGGLAAIRTASNMALGSSYRRQPARVLVVACEIPTLLVRSELESVDKDQAVRIGVCLFSDCASACVLSNNVGNDTGSSPVFDILGWKHEILQDTEKDLGFDVDPMGWKVILTTQVPALASAAVSPAFEELTASIPSISGPDKPMKPADFDWALHPGGSTIITGVQQAVGLTEANLRASYEIYMNCGNSSSATIIAVMHKLRSSEGKENVVACAFGPGISLEMMMLRRRKLATNGYVELNGHSKTKGSPLANGSTDTNGIPEAFGLPAEEVD